MWYQVTVGLERWVYYLFLSDYIFVYIIWLLGRIKKWSGNCTLLEIIPPHTVAIAVGAIDQKAVVKNSKINNRFMLNN